MNEEVEKALKILLEGGIILYPTDTIWGLGCDATNLKAVARIFEIKQRSDEKSLILLVDSDQMLMRYVNEVPNAAWDLIELSDKPITIVYDAPKNLSAEICGKDNTIAIRVTKDPFCVALIRKLKKPLVSTSANVSGKPSPLTFNEISPEIKNAANLIVNLRQDEKSVRPASSIIRIKNNGEVSILRK